MGFWSTLKEKFTCKKVESTTVLPTLQDINKENIALTNVEEKTVESILNSPPVPASQDNVMPSMGPSPEGLPVAAPVIARKAKRKTTKKKVKKAKPKKKKSVVKKKPAKKAVSKKKAKSKPKRKR